MMEFDGDEPPILEIRGLRARTLAGWRDNLLSPILMMSAVATASLSRTSTLQIVILVVAVLLTLNFLWKWARGRIRLYADRIVMISWNGSFPIKPVVVQFTNLKMVRLAGSTLTVTRVPKSEDRLSFRVAVAAPIAEELFDQLEQILEHGVAPIRDHTEGTRPSDDSPYRRR